MLCQVSTETFPLFFLTLLMIMAIGFVAVKVIGMMIQGDIFAYQGIAALGVLIGITIVAISMKSFIAIVVVLMALATAAVFYPYAASQLERLDHRTINKGRIEKCYAAYAARPDNFSAALELAGLMYDHGLRAQAIQLADGIVNHIQSNAKPGDPTQRDYTHVFHREMYKLENWKKEFRGSTLDHLVCPKCHTRNSPDHLNCTQCNSSYILDWIRAHDVEAKFMGKLILCFAVMLLALVSMGWGIFSLGSNAAIAITVAAIATIGATCFFLFRVGPNDLTQPSANRFD